VTENNQHVVTQGVKYAYDVQNRRIAETVNAASSTTTLLSYGNDNNIALTLNGSGALTSSELYGSAVDEALSQIDASDNVLWMLDDREGSVKDSSGAGDKIRIHDNDVGNVVLYQLSYTRWRPALCQLSYTP
jgi:YD repeat-containing protein